MTRAGHLLTAAAVLAAPAGAQVDPPAVRPAAEIVVTAPTPLSDGGVRALLPPAQTAGGAEIAASHAVSLSDYLKRMTGGVFVNDVQDNPLQPDINYRGFTASPLLGTPQGLSVYLDGVRLNQPFGEVVSWDLIPKSAIRSVTLVPDSNPLFGRNSLGGTLSIRTRDGLSDPGYQLAGSYGSFRRRTAEGQSSGKLGGGFDWFASGDYFAERGWRDHSPSEAYQLFGKLGWSDDVTRLTLSVSHADTDLNGNGLQEMRLLAADRASVYTYPDTTRNRADLVNLTATHRVSDALSVEGNLFRRRIRTRTFNGDINDDALGGDLYQPDADEQAVLRDAGYTGVPASGETQVNTAFPKYRCIADILLDSVPNETCNGLANRSSTGQSEWGGTGELTLATRLGRQMNRVTLGLSYVHGRAHFLQSSQFGYLTPDRGVITPPGPGAFADGSQESDDAFDARVDLTGRTSTVSVYALDTIDLARALHMDLSARYDRTTIHNRDGVSPGGGTGSLDSDQRFARLNPAVAVRWEATRAIGVDAAIAQTSRTPSAIELGCADPDSPCRLPNALAGDPPLRQVIARTIEGGIDLTGRSVTARIGAFRTVSRDDILFVADDASGFGYFRNFGRTRRQGLDLDLSARFGRFRLTGHYSWLDATYRSAETVDGSANSSNDAGSGFEGDIAIRKGDRIPLIPRRIVKAALGWEPVAAVSVDLDLIAVSGAYARGNENNADRSDGVHYLGAGRSGAYAVVNLGGEYRPTGSLTLFAQIDNLLDRAYATAAQLSATGFDGTGRFVSRPFPDAAPNGDGDYPLVSSTFLSPGAPRSVRVGARVRF